MKNSSPLKITGYRASFLVSVFVFWLLATGLTACSSGNGGFHLRGSVALPATYKKIYLQGQDPDEPFGKALKKALEEVGSELVMNPDEATAIMQINQYREGKRVAGYGQNREVRQYLIFLKFGYEMKSAQDQRALLPASHISLDRTQIYDSAFVLGKIEEERLIREDLRQSAVRHILLRLRYAQ